MSNNKRRAASPSRFNKLRLDRTSTLTHQSLRGVALGTLKNKVSTHSNSADSVEEPYVSTLMCHTCMWDPQNGTYRAATAPDKQMSRHLEIFSKYFVENKIVPGAPQLCQAACLYPGECGGMSCATSSLGRPRAGPVSDSLPACSRFLPGSNRANHLSLRAATARIR